MIRLNFTLQTDRFEGTTLGRACGVGYRYQKYFPSEPRIEQVSGEQ
jgi:hypothetical protein